MLSVRNCRQKGKLPAEGRVSGLIGSRSTGIFYPDLVYYFRGLKIE